MKRGGRGEKNMGNVDGDLFASSNDEDDSVNSNERK